MHFLRCAKSISSPRGSKSLIVSSCCRFVLAKRMNQKLVLVIVSVCVFFYCHTNEPLQFQFPSPPLPPPSFPYLLGRGESPLFCVQNWVNSLRFFFVHSVNLCIFSFHDVNFMFLVKVQAQCQEEFFCFGLKPVCVVPPPPPIFVNNSLFL